MHLFLGICLLSVCDLMYNYALDGCLTCCNATLMRVDADDISLWDTGLIIWVACSVKLNPELSFVWFWSVSQHPPVLWMDFQRPWPWVWNSVWLPPWVKAVLYYPRCLVSVLLNGAKLYDLPVHVILHLSANYHSVCYMLLLAKTQQWTHPFCFSNS